MRVSCYKEPVSEERADRSDGEPGVGAEAEIFAPRTADAPEVLRVAADATSRGVPAAMATVLGRKGSSPATPGQKLLVVDELSGRVAVGTVGGGAVEHAVLRALADTLAGDGAESRVRSFRLGPELGMCCGGQVEVLIEPLVVAMPALVVGGGHIGALVAPLMAQCGFSVLLSDDRDAFDDREQAPSLRRVRGDFLFAGKNVPRTGIALTMTHDHQLDQRVVEWALRERFAFVGGVGSRAKAARTRARLEQKGFAPEDVARVRMPLGVDIGARSPAEIAVSIVAELIAFRRGKTVTR